MWNKRWVILGIALLVPVLVWELAGAWLEAHGIMGFPTYSRLIVATIPQPFLTLATVGIAAWLCWHWLEVKRREPRARTPYDVRTMFVVILVLCMSVGVGLAIPALTYTGIPTFAEGGSMPNISPNDLALFIAGLLIPVLTAVFKQLKPTSPAKLWTMFVVSLVVGYGALVGTGTIPPFPDVPALPWDDPLALIGALGSLVASLKECVAVVFSIAVVVYELFRARIENAAVKFAALVK